MHRCKRKRDAASLNVKTNMKPSLRLPVRIVTNVIECSQASGKWFAYKMVTYSASSTFSSISFASALGNKQVIMSQDLLMMAGASLELISTLESSRRLICRQLAPQSFHIFVPKLKFPFSRSHGCSLHVLLICHGLHLQMTGGACTQSPG